MSPSAEVIHAIRRRAPELAELAERHVARLTPERWTIEWHLASWLGRTLLLDPRFVAALGRSNVLGLLAVRLEDDLDDGEVPAAEVADSRALGALAFELALDGYRAWFDDRSPVWGFIDRSMAAWRSAAQGPELAKRGAPIKIAGYACCLAGSRLDLWAPLERSLDGAMTALVLYDQFFDWEADLEAGRWNAFVARVLGEDRGPATAAQQPDRRERNRAAVLTALLTRPVVDEHFAATVRAARAAARSADRIGIAGLAGFLMSWADRTDAQGTEIADHYQRAADRATRLLLGTSLGGAVR